MAAKFEIYASGDGYRWRLKAANGEPIALSEHYVTRANAMNGIESVIKAAPEATIVELEEEEE